MSNYNTTLQSNNTDLQAILNTINELPSSGGEQATPEISVNSSGLITATAGAKSSTYQLAFQAAKTITPSTVSQIAVSSGYYTGGNITVAAVPTQSKTVTPISAAQNITPDSGKFLSKVIVEGDSNLVAENIKSGVSIFGVSGTLEEGSGGSGELVDYSENEYAIVMRTISSYTNNRVTNIGSSAFGGCLSLTTVSFPACTSIGTNAFGGCYSLTTVSFPNAATISSRAFGSCYSLTTVSFPNAATIGSYAFAGCRNMTNVNLPMLSVICQGLFMGNNKLSFISFQSIKQIDYWAFYSCYYLSSIIIYTSSVCKLNNSEAFTNTPYAGYSSYFSGTPYIYVPSSLIASYQTATNWTYFSSYFSAIEDAPV